MHQQSSASPGDAVIKTQSSFRNHPIQTRLKHSSTWKIYEKLEWSTEKTEKKLRDMLEKLFKAYDIFSPSVTKILQNSKLSFEEKELLTSTNPDKILVEPNYNGPHIKGPITRSTFVDLIEAFQKGQILHEKYVYVIVHQARAILKTLPNVNLIDLTHLHHIFIIGDLHGQLADLLHIFNVNGLPSMNNPYLFNGDFVDRGSNSVEVILLLLVALILAPSSVFLNRGNHEDHMITLRYGFENEINRKYTKCKTSLLDLFKDIFCWLPIYSSIDTGKSKLMVVHGGISDRIELSQIKSLERNRYVSLSILPTSKSTSQRLTKHEENEYLQMADLLWCDPDPEGRLGCRKNSTRSMGCFFGSNVTEQFLSKNQFSMLIRSHELKEQGYEFEHNNKLLTIFSASNYNAESNRGAIARWDYEADEPWIMSYTWEDIASIGKLNFNKQVTLFEDPVYQSLMEKIMTKKSLLKKEFQRSDRNRTNYISLMTWATIMKNILEIDFPWIILRSKFVKEDEQGILYNTMFEEYTSADNIKFQMSHLGIMDDVYMSNDLLIALFNFLNSNHSGFISHDEFSNAIKLLFDGENNINNTDSSHIDEIFSAMDLDKNRKIDLNEFLGNT